MVMREGSGQQPGRRRVTILGSTGSVGRNTIDIIARQPEAGEAIRGNALLLAALVEGVAFFGVVVGLLLSFKVTAGA